jgi:hypothetical protein
MAAPAGNKFSKGHGAPQGNANASAANRAVQRTIREALRGAMSEEQEIALWNDYLYHAADLHIRWEAFKLAMAYKYDKPAQPVNSAPLHVEPIQVKVEHIGASAEFFAKQAAVLGLK